MLLQRSVEHDSRVRREASALAADGYRVTLLELSPTGGELSGVERRSILPHRLVRLLPLRLLQPVFSVAFLVGILRERADIVHAHDPATLLPGVVGARLTGARVVYDTHELASGVYYRAGVLRQVVLRIERFGIRRANLVVTVSESIASRLTEQYRLKRKPVVIRNFCALPRPAHSDPPGGLRQRLGIDTAPLVLHQGAAAPYRGCETLVRALAALPATHLVFLGPSEQPFAERLTELAQHEGVTGRVHFVPAVPLDDLLAHTAEADVGASLFEASCENYRLTLPNKLFEYVAAGLPVLASAVPEVERIVSEHRIGWTVDPTNPAAVGDALKTAFAHGDSRSIQARLRDADAVFSWSRECAHLLSAYRDIAVA
jgi:glycosyltransferase involved in cell wall biosynthesis